MANKTIAKSVRMTNEVYDIVNKIQFRIAEGGGKLPIDPV